MPGARCCPLPDAAPSVAAPWLTPPRRRPRWLTAASAAAAAAVRDFSLPSLWHRNEFIKVSTKTRPYKIFCRGKQFIKVSNKTRP